MVLIDAIGVNLLDFLLKKVDLHGKTVVFNEQSMKPLQKILSHGALNDRLLTLISVGTSPQGRDRKWRENIITITIRDQRKIIIELGELKRTVILVF